ncbi:hypothetical protein [Sandaracinus amylolyticus]|uniref:hypothetical protein n=1 Tax=Sandaracinus amylolyticus TaxID=927083 RepID=UPI001F321EDC|nr:hypothetical protein [Sandaracinus amylolyticus]UJR80207.1 Hypothetical protein I5071_22510 [Sandaracinus amylolyticus]
MRASTIALGIVLALAGCGAESAPPAQTEIAAAPAPAQPSVAPAAAPSGTPEERCEAVVERHWTEARAILEALGATDASGTREAYLALMPRYASRCAALAPERLDCLERAERTLDGIGACAVNEGLSLGDQLRPPQLPWLVPSAIRPETFSGEGLAADRASALFASLAGTWELGAERLSFAADGTIRVEGRQPAELRGRVFDERAIRGEPVGEGRARNLVVLRAGDELFVSSIYTSQPSPIDASGSAMLIHGDEVFAARGLRGTPECSGWTEHGAQLAEVHCAIESERLVVRYRVGRQVDGTEATSEQRISFRVLEHHVAPDEARLWYRRAQP